MPSSCNIFSSLPNSGIVRRLQDLIPLSGPRDNRRLIAQIRQQGLTQQSARGGQPNSLLMTGQSLDAIQEYLDSIRATFEALFDQLNVTFTENLGIIQFTIRREGYAVLTINDIQSPAINDIRFLNLMAMAVDETDLGLYGTGSIGTSDPETFTPTIVEESRLGTVFSAGDFFLWNDVDPGGLPHYEICQIISIDSDTGEWRIRRAQFCSTREAHSNCVFYRLQPYHFTPAMRQDMFLTTGGVTLSGLPTKWEFLHANKCVVAIFGQPIGPTGYGPLQGTNLAPTEDEITNALGLGEDPEDVDPQLFPITPGHRTMNGAAYLLGISGTISAGQTADFRQRLDAWEQLRLVYGYCGTAPRGETNLASLVVYVVYISPDETQAALIDTLIWRDINATTGARNSYPNDAAEPDTYNPPDGRQMPYHTQNPSFLSWTPASNGAQDWPPNRCPLLDNALDASGNLQSGFTLNTGDPGLILSPDGWVDLWVAQIGSAVAGTDLVVRYQT